MLTLGLHFGHDASISLVDDSSVISCYEIERYRCVKHAIGIKASELQLFFDDHAITPSDIDNIAITSTQGIELLFDEPDLFSVFYSTDASDKLHLTSWSRTMAQRLRAKDLPLEYSIKRLLNQPNKGEGHPFLKYLAHSFTFDENLQSLGVFESYCEINNYNDSNKSLAEAMNVANDKDLSSSFQYPIFVNLLGVTKSGYIFSHHFAHACYAHMGSPSTPKIVVSHDGSLPTSDYRSGAVYVADSNGVNFLCPHYLSIGKLYEVASGFLGFSEDSGAGKMMGLAPYGTPITIEHNLIGNYYDHLRDSDSFSPKQYRFWVYDLCKDILRQALQQGLIRTSSIDGINVSEHPMDERCLVIAATVQNLFEQILVSVCSKSVELAASSSPVSSLVLTGGAALNCPANTRVAQTLKNVSVHVPPAVHDAGLSIGAAWYLNTLNGTQFKDHSKYSLPSTVYLGKRVNVDIVDVKDTLARLPSNSYKLITSSIESTAAHILNDNGIIATFGPRCEIGPRALGSRSIICDARNKDNWERVNKIKGREFWRPFAPIVLAGHQDHYFKLEQNVESYSYMLFTCSVLDSANTPAITHVDRSSRVQILSQDDNTILFNIIDSFSRLSGSHVVMNTSFNGPKEPVIETLDRALQFLHDSADLSAVLVGDSCLVVKA